MNDSDIEDRPDLNAGKEWSEIDLFDLANSVRLKNPIEEIAMLLCRSQREVREKIAEFAPALGQLGRTEEAKVALEKVIAVAPAAFDMYVRGRPPSYRSEDRAHLLEGLRTAGWER